MPFTSIKTGENKGKFRSESGKIYTAKQVRAYFATGGWKRKPITVRGHFRRTPGGSIAPVKQHTRSIGYYDYKHRLEARRDKGIEDLLERQEKREEEHKRSDVKRLLQRTGHHDDDEFVTVPVDDIVYVYPKPRIIRGETAHQRTAREAGLAGMTPKKIERARYR